MSNFDGINDYLIPEVRVYRNLHTGTLSMQKRIKGKGWRVVGHPHGVLLTNAKFIVNEGGRQRVLREKRKNVHAYIQGTLRRELDEGESLRLERLAKYNPYKYDSWVDADGDSIDTSEECIVKATGEVTFA